MSELPALDPLALSSLSIGEVKVCGRSIIPPRAMPPARFVLVGVDSVLLAAPRPLDRDDRSMPPGIENPKLFAPPLIDGNDMPDCNPERPANESPPDAESVPDGIVKPKLFEPTPLEPPEKEVPMSDRPPASGVDELIISSRYKRPRRVDRGPAASPANYRCRRSASAS